MTPKSVFLNDNSYCHLGLSWGCEKNMRPTHFGNSACPMNQEISLFLGCPSESFHSHQPVRDVFGTAAYMEQQWK